MNYTFPIIGNSIDPHVSAAQCAKPEIKSAVTTPQNAAVIIELKFSNFIRTSINKKLRAIKVMQKDTQIISWILFPENDNCTIVNIPALEIKNFFF